MTKYFKTIIQFEVVSEDAPFEGSLEDLAYETTDGGMSGRFLESVVTELTPDEARSTLIAQGSSPEFFLGLSEEGDDDQD